MLNFIPPLLFNSQQVQANTVLTVINSTRSKPTIAPKAANANSVEFANGNAVEFEELLVLNPLFMIILPVVGSDLQIC